MLRVDFFLTFNFLEYTFDAVVEFLIFLAERLHLHNLK